MRSFANQSDVYILDIAVAMAMPLNDPVADTSLEV